MAFINAGDGFMRDGVNGQGGALVEERSAALPDPAHNLCLRDPTNI